MSLGLVLIDGSMSDATEGSIPVADEGLLRGDGVFEVVRLYGGRTFALADHLDRLAASARVLRLPVDVAAVSDDALALAEQAAGRDGALRLVVTRGGRRIAILEFLPEFPPAMSLASVGHAPDPLLAGLKTLSYAAHALATRIAREADADDALLVTPGGRVLEGPSFAVFIGFAPGAPLVTPALSEGILDSITRRRLLGLVDVVARPVAAAELEHAREAFAASTLREVLPVHSIDGRRLSAVPGARTAAATQALAGHIRGELDLDAERVCALRAGGGAR